MRIGIDCRLLQRRGIGRYLKELVNNLAHIDKNNTYILFTSDDTDDHKFLFPKDAKITQKPVPGKILSFTQLNNLRKMAKEADLDIFHATFDHFASFVPAKKKILTIHPPSFENNFKVFTRSKTRLYLQNKLLKWSLNHSDAIIATSDNIHKKIVSSYDKSSSGKLKQKTCTIFNGIGGEYRPLLSKDEKRRISDKYGLSPNFFFSLGSFANYPQMFWSLLGSYASLPREIKEEYHLVLSGEYPAADFNEKIEKLGIKKYVHFIGITPENEMPVLYSNASVFFYFSPYDGFESPPLEAISCGTPIIASRQSDLSESIKNVAVLVDSNNHEEFTKMVKRLAFDKTEYVLIRQMGVERAKRYIWQDTSQQVLKLYHQTIS